MRDFDWLFECVYYVWCAAILFVCLSIKTRARRFDGDSGGCGVCVCVCSSGHVVCVCVCVMVRIHSFNVCTVANMNDIWCVYACPLC